MTAICSAWRSEQCKAVDHIHLCCCHGVQTSNPRLASVLRRFNPHVFELENGVQPILDCGRAPSGIGTGVWAISTVNRSSVSWLPL